MAVPRADPRKHSLDKLDRVVGRFAAKLVELVTRGQASICLLPTRELVAMLFGHRWSGRPTQLQHHWDET